MGLFGLVDGGTIKNVKIVDVYHTGNPIFGRNGYNVTVEDVTIEITGGVEYTVPGNGNSAIFFGNTVDGATFKNVTITTGIAMSGLFNKVSNATFENVVVNAPALTGFSVASTELPEGITFNAPATEEPAPEPAPAE